MRKFICMLIGSVFAGIILCPIAKRIRAEQEEEEERRAYMVEQMEKEAMEEEQRHMKAMEDIEKKGEQELREMDEKFQEDMNKLIAIVEKEIWNYKVGNTGDLLIHCMMKYRDKNGVIHEFDAADPKQFREVMKDRSNTLIF